MDLHLGAIDTTNINKREWGKKETIRKVPKQFKYNKYVEKKVRMHGGMHEHVICKRNCIEPNPILPTHNQFAHI